MAGLVLLTGSCSMDRMYGKMLMRKKASSFEQIDLKDMVDRYINKNTSSVGTIEGIYSVTGVVTKKIRNKEKITDRKENYSKVAVMRDTRDPDREFVEVVIDKDNQMSFSIVGEFTSLTESNLLIYKHLESRGRTSTYTFTYDKAKDVLEGVRTENTNNSTITYKLTYLKLSPKAMSATMTNGH